MLHSFAYKQEKYNKQNHYKIKPIKAIIYNVSGAHKCSMFHTFAYMQKYIYKAKSLLNKNLACIFKIVPNDKHFLKSLCFFPVPKNKSSLEADEVVARRNCLAILDMIGSTDSLSFHQRRMSWSTPVES